MRVPVLPVLASVVVGRIETTACLGHVIHVLVICKSLFAFAHTSRYTCSQRTRLAEPQLGLDVVLTLATRTIADIADSTRAPSLRKTPIAIFPRILS